MSRVLVTGAGGFIGRRAVGPLAERGFEVHAVSSSAPPPEDDGSIRWHAADLLEPDSAARLVASVRPSHLLHFAWYAVPGEYWTSPENVRWVEATLRLMREFGAQGGERAVLAGTCAEYEWGHGTCREGQTPLRPATLYGAAKHATESVVTALSERDGPSAAWGRIFFVYGPGEHPARLVPSVARALLEERAAPCTEGSQVRDFLYVDDVAAAFVELLAGDVRGPVNVGSGEGVALRDLIGAIGSEVGRPDLIELGALPTRPGEPEALVADVERLREEVGFRPAVSRQEGIARTVAWWRERG